MRKCFELAGKAALVVCLSIGAVIGAGVAGVLIIGAGMRLCMLVVG